MTVCVVYAWYNISEYVIYNRWLCYSATIRTTHRDFALWSVLLVQRTGRADWVTAWSYSFWSLFSFHSASCLHWSAMFCALFSHLSLSELLPNTRCSFPLASILFSERTGVNVRNSSLMAPSFIDNSSIWQLLEVWCSVFKIINRHVSQLHCSSSKNMVQLKLLEKLSSAWVQWRLQQKINKQMVQKSQFRCSTILCGMYTN